MEQNNLSGEKSPYLLQHQHNPVWWQPWSEKAFDFAKKNNKLVFISIGYSTCHWCHVMEKESFESEEVAKVLNKYFVSIKIDREERPDVDAIYMKALHMMGRRGGWPMSMFLTPDKNPIWGGTYFPKKRFIDILNSIGAQWKKDPKNFYESSKRVSELLGKTLPQEKGKISKDILNNSAEKMLTGFDNIYGGFGSAPKFPPKMRLRFLMRTKPKSEVIDKTLNSMFKGGMYDHIGGGFARYSVDEKWLIPHFEKMLYDNASLAKLYLEGYQLRKKELYKNIAGEILSYILRDMTSTEGYFFSATDADSEGEEGKFYVWKENELKSFLTPMEFSTIKKIYGVTSKGNFEHQSNNLNLLNFNNLNEVFTPKIIKIRNKIFKERKKRIPPITDDKAITSWNGLMIGALSLGYQVLGDKRYLKAAESAASFIKNKLDNKELYHTYRDGTVKIEAFLTDFAYLIEGLLHLYEANFDPEILRWAMDLQKRQDKALWSKKGYYFAPENPELITRSIDFSDNARPNANGVSLLNLLKLYDYTFNEGYMKKAKTLMEISAARVSKYPGSYAQMLIGFYYSLNKSKEIAIVGESSDPLTQKFTLHLRENFFPNKVVALKKGSTSIPLLEDKIKLGGKATAYVCENKICKLPTNDFETFKRLLK